MKNPQIDLYIEKSAEFAQPILSHLRTLIHKACPDVEEKIKWNFPAFEYKKTILCSMASFKQHCAFGFWLGTKMDDPEGILNQIGESAMGQFGRIRSFEDLPSDDILIRYILHAMELTDSGVRLTKKDITGEKKDLILPVEFEEALSMNDKAKATFDTFSYSNKKEYIMWISEAKTETTRLKRIETSIEWLSEGKVRNWKYIK